MPLQAQLELQLAFALLSLDLQQRLECLLARLLLVQHLALLELQFGLRLESQESQQL